jgi:hypothetical protein
MSALKSGMSSLQNREAESEKDKPGNPLTTRCLFRNICQDVWSQTCYFDARCCVGKENAKNKYTIMPKRKYYNIL